MTDFLKLKKSNCKNCYKCIRHCPVKSIRFSGNQAHIVGDECILCGECFVVCPQNAKEIVSEIEKVKVLIGSGEPVIASIAPSFVANYKGAGISAIRDALRQLGFADAEETAIGATIVKNKYEELLGDGNRDILISSCCHSVNLLIQKYFPREIPFLADVVSPMQAHCLDIKQRIPSAKTVFIGPCVAKKDEAAHYEGIVDAVLTFEELTEWLSEAGIELKHEMDSSEKSKARLFPTTGGILKTMAQNAPGYTYIAVDGVENCMAALRDIEKGRVSKCFIEMSACTGSCVGGPVMEKYHHSPIRDFITISEYAGAQDFDTNDLPEHLKVKHIAFINKNNQKPSEEEIGAILRQMGKFRPAHELNCGSCGYDTCREKAVAIFSGKADLSMCLPFLKARAESFSDNIISNTPNGVVVLNENLEVQQINRAALNIMNIKAASDVMGAPIVQILDPTEFAHVLSSGRSLYGKKVYLTEYAKCVEQTIIYDKDYHIIICLMRDVTEDEAKRERKEELSRRTAQIADNVVNKQMRIVQEIASLLGETAAETKIALTKLKESMKDE